MGSTLGWVFFDKNSLVTCFAVYSFSDRVNSFVTTNWEMSTLLHRRSEMVCCAYSTAAFGSRLIRIRCRQVLIRFATNGQLSRRTVSIPEEGVHTNDEVTHRGIMPNCETFTDPPIFFFDQHFFVEHVRGISAL